MRREGTFWHDPAYFTPPRGDGPYWIYDHDRGSIYVIVHENNHWHDCTCDGMQGKEVIAGPLLLPPQEILDRQAEHFETVRRTIEAEVGFDPVWDVGELMHHGRYFDTRFPMPPPVAEPPPSDRRKHRKKIPSAPKPPYVAPYEVIDGYYWSRATSRLGARVRHGSRRALVRDAREPVHVGLHLPDDASDHRVRPLCPPDQGRGC